MGEINTGFSVIRASVDVGRFDIDQMMGAIGLANGYQKPHCELLSFSQFTGEERPILFGELHQLKVHAPIASIRLAAPNQCMTSSSSGRVRLDV